jgi:hypothetical protein
MFFPGIQWDQATQLSEAKSPRQGPSCGQHGMVGPIAINEIVSPVLRGLPSMTYARAAL